MNILKAAAAPLIVGSAFAISGCNNPNHQSEAERSRRKVLTELMADKPAKDYDSIVEGWGRNDTFLRESKVQSSVDSVAYRNLFEGTVLANDSSKVKEFNLIPKNTRPNVNHIAGDSDYDNIINSLDNKLKNMEISKKDFDISTKEYDKMKHYRSTGIGGECVVERDKIVSTRQFKADSMAYEKFFKENNVLTDSLKKEIKKVAKVIKP